MKPLRSKFNPTLPHNEEAIAKILKALENHPMSYLGLSRVTKIDYETIRSPVCYLKEIGKIIVRPTDENLPYPSRNNKAIISLAIRDL